MAGRGIETPPSSSSSGGGGVSSFSKQGSSAITGAVTISQGSGVTLTQTGQNIAIASSGSMVYPGQTGIAVMGASTWSTSISGTSSQFVKGDGSLDSGAYVTSHNILSATHLDTLADTVARGDILYGNATPKWARLPFPATPTGKILQATATDVAWSTNALTIGASASVSGSNTGDQTLPTDVTIVTTDVTTNNASTTKHGWEPKSVAPAANVLNVVGIANGETVTSMKTLFDGTTPATMTSGGSGSAGTSLTAAHRDHTHPFTNPAIDTLAAGTDITTLNASTTAHGLVVKAVAPAANALNVVGIANAETAYTNKTILTTTTPSTQAFGDSAAAGTNLDAAHSDHKHAMPASPKDTTAQTGILKGNGSTISAVTAPTGTIVGTLDSQALTNKTYESYSINATPTANNIPVLDANAFLPKAAVQSIATVTVSNVTTSVAINADITGTYEITAQAGAVLFSNPTGTLVNNQKLIIKIIDNGTARAITWGTNFRAMGTALPSTTVLSKHLVMGFIYNITDTKWDCVAANYEA